MQQFEKEAKGEFRIGIFLSKKDLVSRVLSRCTQLYNSAFTEAKSTKVYKKDDLAELRPALAPAVRLLADTAATEHNLDSTNGQCMLGICASTAEEGVATLKAWGMVLQLPSGLLHGMDKDKVPFDLSGRVYIKYNAGEVYTFKNIRKSGMRARGCDARTL